MVFGDRPARRPRHRPRACCARRSQPPLAVDFLIHQDFHVSFAVLGAAVLAVTRGEAMYADMGHFGRVLGAVIGFGTSDALAGAYGIAVSLLMAIATLLAALVAIQWGYPPVIVIAVNGLFFMIDCIFFAANLAKLFEGGWFPLLLASVVAFLMLTWRSGVQLVENARGKLRQPEEDLIETAVSKCTARPCGQRLSEAGRQARRSCRTFPV
jgi:K+ transporter